MDRKLKILYTIPNFISAGSGEAMLNIIRRLNRDRFEPAVAVLRLGGKLDEVVRRMGIPLIEAPFVIPVKPYSSLIARARQAALGFRQYGFDLWHSFHYGDDYTEALIARFSGARHWVFTKKNMSWGSRAWLGRCLLASAIAAQNTDMMGNFFSSPLFRGKTRLIPRGVNLDQFRPTEETQIGVGASRSMAGTAIRVGCLAHLVPVKGHPTLIDALARLPEAQLFLAGKPMDAEYTQRLKDQAAELNLGERVQFLGGVEDVPTFLAGMDIMVLPTWDRWRREGCPVALLEAMACGKACVATKVPGSRDIVEDGVSGLLVEPENATQMAEAIRRLIGDPDLRNGLGKAARRRIEERFSIEREVAAHEAMYEEIMSGRRAR